MRVGLFPFIAMLMSIAGCSCGLSDQPAPVLRQAAIAEASAASQVTIQQEVARLRAALSREVPQHSIVTTGDDPKWISRAKLALAVSESLKVDRPQLLVVVDRNPAVQEMRIVLAQPGADWQVIGGSKISTGQAGRRYYYITPTGIFRHTDDILDYRALGTFNENHIRGLGLKGMRVWDFGWQPAEKGWRSDREQGDIRLLMHATDPDYLEGRLGRPASQGCVRIPASMNRFLDIHGVLDADYERDARDDPRIGAVLFPEREPTPLAGNTLVIIDSSLPS
jgi:L,D-transpeptidase catalytic domain